MHNPPLMYTGAIVSCVCFSLSGSCISKSLPVETILKLTLKKRKKGNLAESRKDTESGKNKCSSGAEKKMKN